MQNRTLGIVATVLTAFLCGCISLFSCALGAVVASGTPIDVTLNGVTVPRTFPPTAGFTMICLSLLLLLVPVAVGFFTLRKRSQPPL